MTSTTKNEEEQQQQIQDPAGQTEILQMAIRCAKQGQRAVARTLLSQVCSREPNNENAWMWRASLAETADEGLVYLEQVLRLNPTNPKALAWLEKATAPLRTSSHAVPKPPVATVSVPAPTPAPTPAPMPVAAEPPPPPAAAVPQANLRLRTFLDSIPETKLEAEPVTAPQVVLEEEITVEESTPVKREPACPLCGAKVLMDSVTHCPTCGGMTEERIPGDFARNTWIQREVLESAVERLKKLADGTSFENEYWLAIAYMNLLETGEAVKQAQRAIAVDPNDERVAAVLRPYLARPRVLVVDDSTTIREVVTRTLEKKGYAAASSKNGLYALGDASDFKPALILLDIAMPVMDGYQVCAALKKNPGTKNIPVVMLSGKDGIFDKVKGRIAGATEHIGKPFKPENLVKSVNRYAPLPVKQ